MVTGAGEVRGEIGPFPVELPWWQEAGPIADLLPGSVVLRLIEADPARSDGMGGAVTYVVEYDGLLPEAVELRSWNGDRDLLAHHPLRLPWARPGGPAADLRWVASQVSVAGSARARQERTWNLSAIWSVPAVVDGRPTTVWLKCLPPFFAHEPAVLEIMGDLPVPRVLAHDRHRMLLAEMAGRDGYEPTKTEERAMIESLVDLQVTSVRRVDALLAAGVPDLRTPRMVAELTDLVHRLAPNDAALRSFVDDLPARLAQVDAAGMPDVLIHGDPHGGNCRIGVSPPVWFDWGDSAVGNPLLDVAATHRMSEPTVGHWLDRWSAAVPGSRPHRVWELLKPVALLRMAWVYQRFCDNIEPSEQVYHRSDVAKCLDNVRQAL